MKTTEKKIVGGRLATERERMGWSQKEAAAKVGIGYSTWCAYEQGRSWPTADVLMEASEGGIDVHYVLFGTANASRLTPDEMTMLCYWRESPDELRAAWLAFYRAYVTASSRDT
ncbi:helix-turn-helix domain-containing protein [Laribacter hongkongensis]|uniref:helix-turn-helix domain-containing protein n=1 Tax=Laribacter hongkongensis TaxID=168471 RepID=UPI001EFCB86D|nr:helix-turn-helix transcriptional regulator [Laribacter hongkongensis]MCG9079929.1 helix-turn-helix domain-containing protein [Laribacter hongkongensis]